MLNKYHLLQALLNFVYEKTEIKLKELLQQIHSHQASFTITQGSFRYKGKIYYAFDWATTNIKHLDENLYPYMYDYLKQSEQLEVEELKVSSYLQAVLNQVSKSRYLYSYLPSALHPVLRQEGILDCGQEETISNLDKNLMLINQEGYELLMTRLMLNMVE